MPMGEVAGWYMDAVEQRLGQIIAVARNNDIPTLALRDMFMDPTTADGTELPTVEHLQTLALSLAICVRRLARVDMPT